MNKKLIKTHENVRKKWKTFKNEIRSIINILKLFCWRNWYIYIYIYIYNIVDINKKYKFDKCILIIKLYQILFDDNIVIFDYNMFNFKIYLILKLWYNIK